MAYDINLVQIGVTNPGFINKVALGGLGFPGTWNDGLLSAWICMPTGSPEISFTSSTANTIYWELNVLNASAGLVVYNYPTSSTPAQFNWSFADITGTVQWHMSWCPSTATPRLCRSTATTLRAPS